MRPQTLTEVAERIITGSEFHFCIKEFIDEIRYLRLAHQYSCSDRILASIKNEPVRINDVHDAFIAALAEYIAIQESAAPPAWTEDSCRFLSEPVFAGGRHARDYMLEHTAFSLRKRLLFVGEIVI